MPKRRLIAVSTGPDLPPAFFLFSDASMSTDRQNLVTKLREDHAYLHELMAQISTLCERDEQVAGCKACSPQRQTNCISNIEHLIRTFIEATLHHNMLESACMQDLVPREHRLAHNQDHLLIAERLKAVRMDFRQTGNGIAAIDDIAGVMNMLAAHIDQFDQPLEGYLLAA